MITLTRSQKKQSSILSCALKAAGAKIKYQSSSINFFWKNDQVLFECCLIKDQETDEPYIWIDELDVAEQQQGMGTALRHILFDAVDAAGISVVKSAAVDSGRYAQAAWHARCWPSRWPELQKSLFKNLQLFGDDSDISNNERSIRQRQARSVRRIIEVSDGQLGTIVAASRLPVSGGIIGNHPTLAKFLFLYKGTNNSKLNTYNTLWTQHERDLFRAAYPKTTESIVPLRGLAPQIKPATLMPAS